MYILICSKSIRCKEYVQNCAEIRGIFSSCCFNCRVARKKMSNSLRKKVTNPFAKIHKKNLKAQQMHKKQKCQTKKKVKLYLCYIL